MSKKHVGGSPHLRLPPHKEKKIKEHMMATQGARCRWCKKKDNKLQLDHIKPLSRGGGWRWDNLQLLCRTCHRKKTKEDTTRYSKRGKINPMTGYDYAAI